MPLIPHDDPLSRLRAEFGDEWRIWRVHDSDEFMATRRLDDDVEPTIGPAASCELEERLRSPGLRFGRLVSQQQVHMIAHRLDRL